MRIAFNEEVVALEESLEIRWGDVRGKRGDVLKVLTSVEHGFTG